MRVLLVRLGSLGEVVHALPVLQDLRSAHRDAVVDWVVEPAVAPMLRRVEGIGAIIECPKPRGPGSLLSGKTRQEWAAFKRRLRTERYDAVLDLQGVVRSAWIASRAHGPSCGPANGGEGAEVEWPARLLLKRTVPVDPRAHAIDRARELGAKALGYQASGAPRFGLAGRSPRLEKRTVVFVHAASRADRLWPEARWVALGRHFIERGWDIVMPHGSETEQVQAERLAAEIDSKMTAFGQATRHTGPVVQVWPRLKLDAIVDRMAACSAVVGVDSGLSHMALALDLPMVQIYNHPTAWRTGPLPSMQRQVAIGGASVPSLEDVWATWKRLAAQTGLAK